MAAWICGSGMMTAVGDTTLQTASSVRAGICRYAETAIFNRQRAHMTLALVPEASLPPLADEFEHDGLTSRQCRMIRLAGPAMVEALQRLPQNRVVPLYLAVPEALPESPPVVDETFLDRLARSRAQLDRSASRLFPQGRAGGLHALAAAVESLGSGAQNYVLVGGVDSYLDLGLLSRLDLEGRIMAEGVMNGFVPGEAAAFLLLCSERVRTDEQVASTVRVGRPGLAEEPGHRYSEEPYLGDGLSEALAAALEEESEAAIGTVFASFNGESFGAKEWGVAALRSAAALGDGYRLEHPAECFGDVGAAFGPLLIGLAQIGMTKSYLQGDALVFCASDGPARGAVRVVSDAS